MAKTAGRNRCCECGGPHQVTDHDHGACRRCRSPKGRMAGLEIELRTTRRRSLRWLQIREEAIRLFGERPDVDLLEEVRRWFSAKYGLHTDSGPGQVPQFEGLLTEVVLKALRAARRRDQPAKIDWGASEPVVSAPKPSAKPGSQRANRENADRQITAALRAWHQKRDGTVTAPIGLRQLARQLDGRVTPYAVEAWFKRLGGYEIYTQLCATDNPRLISQWLRTLSDKKLANQMALAGLACERSCEHHPN